jgi:hypothetical protein
LATGGVFGRVGPTVGAGSSPRPPIEIAELRDAGVDWSLLGFDADDLAKLFDAADGVKQGLTDPDDIPAPPDEAITQPGDPVDSRGTPAPLWRQRIARGRGPAA